MKARPISIGFPSGKLKMTLWGGTEDKETFPIMGTNTNQPYCKAYGIRYNLTETEIKNMKALQALFKEDQKRCEITDGG